MPLFLIGRLGPGLSRGGEWRWSGMESKLQNFSVPCERGFGQCHPSHNVTSSLLVDFPVGLTVVNWFYSGQQMRRKSWRVPSNRVSAMPSAVLRIVLAACELVGNMVDRNLEVIVVLEKHKPMVIFRRPR
uniref:Secreted protein n=1 Tax=Ascaris lumbricoides TaxID=6252 RepID=A0A0M3IMZ2_ASCLU